jgi:hypothetical protein
MLAYVIALMSSNMDYLKSKTRSQEVKICKHSSDYCFNQTILEVGLKVCFDDF